MPRYDYRCAQGHTEEVVAGFDDELVACGVCGLPARRLAVYAPLIGVGAIPPMGERRIPLNTFVEAQGEMVRNAERTGVPAPDVLAIAQRQARSVRKHAPELVTGS